MTKFCFIALLVVATMSCNSPKNVTIGVHVEGAAADAKSVIVTADSTYEITLDSTGSAIVALAEPIKAEYGKFGYGRVKIPVFIEPGKSFDISLKMEERRAIPEFTGEGAKKNEYLNSPVHRSFQPDFKAEEQAFITSLEDGLKQLYANLDTLGFDVPFVQLEKQRLHYNVFSVMPMYPSYHVYYAQVQGFAPSEVYYNYLKSLIKEDESLMQLDQYKSVMADFVQVYSTKDMKEFDPLLAVKTQLEYVDKNITNPAIAGFLVDKYATAYVGRSGVEHLAEISPIYNAKVTCPSAKAKFEELCGKWAKIAKGEPSPSFKYMDIDGKEVSLEDLAGKYVFIDVWATWCGPCRGEIPALKELEHKFKDKNIHFVSISCDQDKSAWEKMVKEDKLGGIQLHNGADREFMETFMISGIPRFILLDREGKIVASDMSRPSNPVTVETLTALEGI